jgi:hypothetical protein
LIRRLPRRRRWRALRNHYTHYEATQYQDTKKSLNPSHGPPRHLPIGPYKSILAQVHSTLPRRYICIASAKLVRRRWIALSGCTISTYARIAAHWIATRERFSGDFQPALVDFSHRVKPQLGGPCDRKTSTHASPSESRLQHYCDYYLGGDGDFGAGEISAFDMTNRNGDGL